MSFALIERLSVVEIDHFATTMIISRFCTLSLCWIWASFYWWESLVIPGIMFWVRVTTLRKRPRRSDRMVS